jgi:hypothetical protein
MSDSRLGVIEVSLLKIVDSARAVGEHSRLQWITQERSAKAIQAIRELQKIARDEIALPRTVPRIERILLKVSGPELFDLQTACKELLKDLERDLERYRYFAIPSSVAAYLDPALIMQSLVAQRSNAAALELYSASRCLAKGEPTACALHAIRAMEFGLRVAGRSLGIEATTLESICEKIDSLMTIKYQAKPKSWRKAEPFYAQLEHDIRAFARGYRNPGMHGVGQQYTKEEAHYLLTVAVRFMNHLAEHFADFDKPKRVRA